MLYTLAVFLLVAWLLGVVGSYPVGGSLVHLLLLMAIALFVLGVIGDRRTWLA